MAGRITLRRQWFTKKTCRAPTITPRNRRTGTPGTPDGTARNAAACRNKERPHDQRGELRHAQRATNRQRKRETTAMRWRALHPQRRRAHQQRAVARLVLTRASRQTRSARTARDIGQQRRQHQQGSDSAAAGDLPRRNCHEHSRRFGHAAVGIVSR